MSIDKKYWVTMVDTFMSGWGHAEDKINLLIFHCDNLEEAEIVADNAHHRSDQDEITIWTTDPSEHFDDEDRFYVQHYNKDSYPRWYQRDYFRDMTEKGENQHG